MYIVYTVYYTIYNIHYTILTPIMFSYLKNKINYRHKALKTKDRTVGGKCVSSSAALAILGQTIYHPQIFNNHFVRGVFFSAIVCFTLCAQINLLRNVLTGRNGGRVVCTYMLYFIISLISIGYHVMFVRNCGAQGTNRKLFRLFFGSLVFVAWAARFICIFREHSLFFVHFSEVYI